MGRQSGLLAEERPACGVVRLDRRVAVGRTRWGFWAGQNLGAQPWVGGGGDENGRDCGRVAESALLWLRGNWGCERREDGGGGCGGSSRFWQVWRWGAAQEKRRVLRWMDRVNICWRMHWQSRKMTRRLRGSKVQALKMGCLQGREACKVWERVVGGSGECRLYHVVLLLGSHNFWDLPGVGGSAAFWYLAQSRYLVRGGWYLVGWLPAV